MNEQAIPVWEMRRLFRLRRCLRLGAFLGTLLLGWNHSWSQPAPQAPAGKIAEESLKAAFIYKFLGYAEWPASSFSGVSTPYVIGTMHADDIASELAQIVPGRTINNRPIELRKLKEGASLQGIHLLVIGELRSERLNEMIAEAQRRSILTVTQSSEALAAGSIINLVTLDRKVRFEVSLDAAEKSRIRLSSRLLPVAYRVLPKGS